MGSAMQLVDTHNGQQIGTDAADVGSHTVQHPAQLLDIGFAGSIIDSGSALGHDGGHHNVGRTCDRGFIKEHVGAFQLLGVNLVDSTLGHMVELRT